jgi:hypothetical protein
MSSDNDAVRDCFPEQGSTAAKDPVTDERVTDFFADPDQQFEQVRHCHLLTGIVADVGLMQIQGKGRFTQPNNRDGSEIGGRASWHHWFEMPDSLVVVGKARGSIRQWHFPLIYGVVTLRRGQATMTVAAPQSRVP